MVRTCGCTSGRRRDNARMISADLTAWPKPWPET
jgi:hypothetical protein